VLAAQLAGGKFIAVGQTQNKNISFSSQGARLIMFMEGTQELKK